MSTEKSSLPESAATDTQSVSEKITGKDLGTSSTDNLPLSERESAIEPANSVNNLALPDKGTDVLDSILNKGPQKVNLVIHINVPHNTKALDWCTVYPYPVAPPVKKKEITALGYKDKQLRTGLLAMAYWSRTNPGKIYPAGGWRNQYALAAAMEKSGSGYPNTIFTEYPWVDNIIPFMRKEIFVINAKEEERKKRYQQMQQVFNDYRAEIEAQALNKGLFPIEVKISREVGGHRRGQVLVDKNNWWIVAVHKVPGLKYYWLYPVKLSDNPQQGVTLNEDNAIFIEGAW